MSVYDVYNLCTAAPALNDTMVLYDDITHTNLFILCINYIYVAGGR